MSSSPDLPSKAVTSVDSWAELKQWTPARIAQVRVGGSLALREVLDFKLSHARARDAVHQVFQIEDMRRELETLPLNVLELTSQAKDRFEYLQRPDRGRRLSAESSEKCVEQSQKEGAVDLVIILADGLSATATHKQAIPVVRELLNLLSSWKCAPIVLIPLARVAVQDEVGELLRSRLALILLGERPGLGSPDSLGAYLVHGPKLGNTDAERNCLSNIRQGGMSPRTAAYQLFQLLTQARELGYSGVNLKAGDTVARLI
ncbi:MAG: ethanolamine ammonia-lyase subunit EutC [Blastochloris sp.]|jgi:ethanolamine ammonia-lyase small subunit|nr:ethanolamine ammonia-lyase subunit EutC [Blastochloris sp.]